MKPQIPTHPETKIQDQQRCGESDPEFLIHSWFWGTGKELKDLKKQIDLAASFNSNILIVGETGTGKEYIARYIYTKRKKKSGLNQTEAPFIGVNAGSLPESLIESILFGHERGAFTSARERQLGKFELARKGTLFLDEIQNLPISCQVKLLRVLQYRDIERIGAKDEIKSQCQVVAASNIPLEMLVSEGKFRRDLYFRLNIFPIFIPSLRSRKADLPVIIFSLLSRACRELKIPEKKLSPEVLQLLLNYSWPGNIRELEHSLLYAALRAETEQINLEDLPWSISGKMTLFIKSGSWNV